MRFYISQSRRLLHAVFAIAAISMAATPALAGSRSATMGASTMVISSCRLSFQQGTPIPQIRSACTRGVQARVVLAPTHWPPAYGTLGPGKGGVRILTVTY